jgi:hypothetical protein
MLPPDTDRAVELMIRFAARARELAEVAHRAFVYSPPQGGARRMRWKLSIDLSTT